MLAVPTESAVLTICVCASATGCPTTALREFASSVLPTLTPPREILILLLVPSPAPVALLLPTTLCILSVLLSSTLPLWIWTAMSCPTPPTSTESAPTRACATARPATARALKVMTALHAREPAAPPTPTACALVTEPASPSRTLLPATSTIFTSSGTRMPPWVACATVATPDPTAPSACASSAPILCTTMILRTSGSPTSLTRSTIPVSPP
mmetsp:Transcript_12897/g.22628  ORF Transcript_12897/g.22628 Transcript_12897/m.22628 type:complete len:212 (+) Transcript_12897:132-767(+)